MHATLHLTGALWQSLVILTQDPVLKQLHFIFVAGKQWEILTYIGVILVYALITIHLWRVIT